MKIGIDARFWNESGVGRYTRNLVFQLQKIDSKNQYVLFTLSKDYDQITASIEKWKIENEKWKIVTANIPWHSLEEQIKYPKILEKENLDLMHFPYFSIPVFYNKPYVVTIHDLILHHFSTGKATTRHPLIYHGKRLGYKYIMKHAAQKSRKIITVSQSTKQEIIDHLNIKQDKIVVTYEGVGLLASGIKRNLNINNNKYLLHIGNLYPHKNMDFVLTALARLNEDHKIKIPLVIAGKEDYFYEKFKNKINELNLQDQVACIGEINNDNLIDLYTNALALVSPSLMEGFDLPVVEAMSSNCLVIASDIPVHREICQNSAVYFDLKSNEDLIQKLNQIFTNGKEYYNKKIKEGKSLSGKFNWNDMAVETLEIYKQVLTNY